MRIIIILLGLALLAIVPQLAQIDRAEAKQRKTLQTLELNTKAFACDGKARELAADIRGANIRKVYAWFGAYGGTNADITVALGNYDKQEVWHPMAVAGWDHYAEPTGIANQVLWFDFTPEGIRAQDVRMFAACNPMDEVSKTKKAHVIVLIYYTGDK